MPDESKVAVITGGAGNVGSKTVQIMAENGWHVVVPWRSRSSWDELIVSMEEKNISEACTGFETDLTEEAEVQRLMQHASELKGRIDALINLVGMFKFGTNIWETGTGEWDKILDVNLKSVFLCCKHALPFMMQTGSGTVINTTSKAAIDLQPGAAAYAVSKAGVITLTQALREELRGKNVQVNALMPGIIDTPVTRKLMPKGNADKWVKPALIAKTVLGLCERRIEGVNGSVLRMFGEL